MATIKLDNINKIYPNGVHAVVDFNLDVAEGEFIVLVGPSGCGKSTTLRMIAGLEEISSGDFLIDDLYMNDKAPKDRDIAMVFQNYALYAHMTVYHNMAFSLVIRKANSDYIHERVMWAADILGLTNFLNRRPANLSGGQRQRVAVGRAMVRNPKVFLFDEPLSNLDAKLRGIMRKELKLLHHQLKTTMLYVTHDQIEALTLADRIVIMRDGFVQQIGSPTAVYQYPYNLFVARFMGLPAMNIFDVEILDDAKVKIDDYIYELTDPKMMDILTLYANTNIKMGVRPEHIKVEKRLPNSKGVKAKIVNLELLGPDILLHLEVGNINKIAKIDAREEFEIGQEVDVSFLEEHTYFFGADLTFGKGEGRIFAQSLFSGEIAKHVLAANKDDSSNALVGIKPEDIALFEKPTETSIQGKIINVKPIGLNALYMILVGSEEVLVNTKHNKALKVDEPVYLQIEKFSLIDKKTRRVL